MGNVANQDLISKPGAIFLKLQKVSITFIARQYLLFLLMRPDLPALTVAERRQDASRGAP
jgi:hypothetical protein